MSSTSKPTLIFRVYPEKSSRLYFQVRWYLNVTRMRRGYAKWMPHRKHTGARYAEALTCHVKIVSFTSKRPYHNPLLGVIFLHHKKCGAIILSHEATHATMFYFIRLKLEHNNATDERFATIAGNLVAQMVKRVW